MSGVSLPFEEESPCSALLPSARVESPDLPLPGMVSVLDAWKDHWSSWPFSVASTCSFWIT